VLGFVFAAYSLIVAFRIARWPRRP
jgi:hypothetical protein